MTMESMERLEFLLAMRATEGVSAAEEHEIAELSRLHPEIEIDSYDLAAADLLAGVIEEQPIPETLAQRLTLRGEELVRQASREAAATVVPFQPSKAQPRPALLGWLAAAACLLLAIAGWWPRLEAPAPVMEARSDEAPVPNAAEKRRLLLAEEPDVQLLSWTATEDPSATAAGGDVVWSPSRQRGFMRIERLESNDPAASQYQLWIFDRERDERYPVDGGVFDMPAGETETVVPIDAKILVKDPYLFAVTVEVPGGVVVSDRERIVLLAQAAT